MVGMARALARVYRFYRDGFRSMTVGRTLWVIILLKLVLMFAVLKVFFFRDYLSSRCDTNEQKGRYVLEELMRNEQ